jgi:hypothetical protein
MGTKIKTFESTGLAPNGRLYAGDLNGIQDHLADQSNFSQQVDAAVFGIGETTLQLMNYGPGEARLSGAMRIDGIFRGLGGLVAGAFTTAQRNAIPVGLAPYGLIILNTQTNQYEFNKGTDAARNWQALGFVPASGTLITDADISPTANIDTAKFENYPNDVRKQLNGDGTWSYPVLTINQRASSYTLALTDSNVVVEMNAAGANTLTVPANAAVAFPIGTTVEVAQMGAGQTSVAASGGVTIRAYNNSLKLAGQFAVATLIKRATDEWWLAGNIVP